MSAAQEPWYRTALTLFGGSVVAQALPFIAAPLIARLFTAEHFAVFGTAMTAFGLFSVLAAGRYEMAVVAPADDHESANVVRGALRIAFLVGVLAFFAIALWGGTPVVSAKLPGLGKVVWMVALLTTLAGIQVTLQQWLLRHKAFRIVARLKVIQAVGITVATVGFGLAGWNSGLEAGYMVGWALFTLATALHVRYRYPLAAAQGRHDWPRALKKYRAWPLVNSWPALTVAVASGGATIFMAAYQPAEWVGQHNFARQYVLVPVSMVAIAVGQVLLVRCAECVRSKRPLHGVVWPVVRSLMVCAVLIMGVLALFGKDVFAWVFGDRWSRAGEASSVLVFGYGVQLVSAPLSMVLIAMGRLKATLIFPISFILLLAVVPLFKHLGPIPFMAVLSGVEVMAYAVQAAVVLLCVWRHDRSLAP